MATFFSSVYCVYLCRLYTYIFKKNVVYILNIFVYINYMDMNIYIYVNIFKMYTMCVYL